MPAPKVTYRPNRRDMRKFLSSPEMAKIVEAPAQKGKAYAEKAAPRESGDYADAFEVQVRQYGDRKTALLVNTARHAAAVETRERVLARAANYMK